MNSRRLRYISGGLYAISFLLILSLIGFLFNVIYLTHIMKIIITVLSFLSIYFAGVFGCEKDKHRFKNTILVLFVFYVTVLLDFTLIDDSLGRNIFNIFSWSRQAFNDYLANNVNLIPFATVRLFINGYKSDALSFIPVFENLLGNLFAFMPFAFFIPVIFRAINKWYLFLAVTVASVLAVELFQFIFLTGSTDIDDLILNTIGAMLAYEIIKIKGIKKLLSVITFGVSEKD